MPNYLLQPQPKHANRAVGAYGEGRRCANFAGWLETAFFHHPARSRIVDKMPADERANVGCAPNVVEHHSQRLGADAESPIWLCHPIADGWLAVEGGQPTVARRSIAHSTDRQTIGFQHNSPRCGIRKHRAYHLTAFVDRCVCEPSGSRSYVGVGSKSIEHRRIFFAPAA